MMKRVTWFVGGVAAGAAGATVARRKVRAAAAELSPAAVARKAKQRAVDAWYEGRRAAQHREAELRARMEGRVESLADELDEGDAVLVDGRPVEPGQVIVLRQVREGRDGREGSRTTTGKRRNRA
jgi:hypothetical protein